MPELTQESTHEDIQKFVDQIVEDRKGDEQTAQKTEPKGDGQAIAEERDKPTGDMTAEPDDTGSKETAPKGEDTAKGEEESTSWIDDDVKKEVAAYGIDEKVLADFANREELDRALRLFDQSALEAGRKAMAEGETDTGRDEQGRFKGKESEEKEAQTSDGKYEVSLDKDIYDEDLVGEFNRMRDHYESRLAAIEGRFAEADERAEEQRYDSLVDSLGHSDLLGKSGKETPKQLKRREDLFVAVKAQQLGLEQLGRPAELDEALVNRVARMVFADELGKKDLKQRTQRVSKQSAGRMGGSATKAHQSTQPLREEMRQLYKELDDAG